MEVLGCCDEEVHIYQTLTDISFLEQLNPHRVVLLCLPVA